MTAKSVKKNFLIYWALAPVFAFMLGWILFHYFFALKEINKIDREKRYVYSTLKGLNLLSLISVELQAIFLDDISSTSTIRNKPILDDIYQNIEVLVKIDDFMKGYKDQNGKLGETFEGIFYGISCDQVYSELYYVLPKFTIEECLDLSKGTGNYGLTHGFAEMVYVTKDLLERYLYSDRAKSTLRNMYPDIISSFIKVLDVNTALLFMIYDRLDGDYIELVKKLKKNGVGLAVTAVPVVAVLIFITWKLLILPLLYQDLKRKRLLKLIPAKMLYHHKYLKKWINNNTQGRIELGSRQ